jgi:Putative zincin peptidase
VIMPIPGWLIALLTFPGVIVHESAHFLFCRLRGVAVFDVCFFQVGGNPAGYVVHEQSDSFTTTFLVSTGPFFVNTALCFLICLPAFVPLRIFQVSDPLSYFLLWFGVSIGMHAFPSPQDANVLWGEAKRFARSGNLLAILSFPLVVVIYIAHFLSFFWFDAIYGFAVGLLLPELILDYLV